MQSFDKSEIDRIIRTALTEDIGAGDITSELTIPTSATAEMTFIAGQELVACGIFIPETVFKILGHVKTESYVLEGRLAEPGTILAKASGCARTLLAGERVALNLMQRMSGVATLTRKYVDAVKGTKAIILDTRKTMPGLRALDKYAVRIGGGQNHRMRLDDMVIIKDNHLALRKKTGEYKIQDVVKEIREKPSAHVIPPAFIPLIIECDTLEQMKEALVAKPDRILLDNMNVAQLKEAVRLSGSKVPLEASGGVSLENVRKIAETGVDYISVGKLTHSAPAVDIRADINIRS